ncbi:MAG: cobalamin B12-binding domain-containing protein [Sediminibacterium sp.]|nr:cobalamin B12-binding domain-containing protein [Sediminibacterium sp.]
MNRPIRVLIAKIGLDGHDRGAKVISTGLKNAGMEVIYTGLRQTPEMVVKAAIQEDVDAIGISILSGAHITVFTKIIALLKQENITDIILTGGGIIPQEDINTLYTMGVHKLFTPGTNIADIANYLKQEVPKHKKY